MARHGVFITIEGGEGAGKSTQTHRLADFLRSQGRRVVETREPGGTPTGERIRELVKHHGPAKWHGLTETLLFLAARREHLDRVILPALASGTWVVCDRFADSTMAYQSYGAGLEAATITALHELVMPGIKPDLTIVLDIPPDGARRRIRARGARSDRFERRKRAFHDRVRFGFREIAATEPERCVLIDATGSEADVGEAIATAVRDRLALRRRR